MTQDQIITIQNFINGARASIKAHNEYRDNASLRALMYSMGKLTGAYSILGNRCDDAHVHASVQEVHAEYEAVSFLDLYK